VRRSVVKGLSRIFDLSTEPTALLQPIQNLERSIFRDCAPLENSAGKLSESYAEISRCAGLCFADSILLKKSFQHEQWVAARIQALLNLVITNTPLLHAQLVSHTADNLAQVGY
jgi:hypothetical protein